MSTRPSRPPADVHEAFRAVVHDFGVADMAAKTGINPGTLYNKANLNDSSAHKPTLGDAVLVQVIANDVRILEAMAATLGRVCMQLPSLDGVSDDALVEMIAEIQAQNGLWHEELRNALRDKRFTRDEYKAIHGRALHWITAILEAVHRIEGLVDD